MNEKSGSKSGKRPGTFVGKGDPRNGRGPARGAPNAGRPPSAVAKAAREIVERHRLLEVAAAIAVGPSKDADSLAAIKLLLAYGYGAPVQPLDHDGEIPHEDALDQLA